MSIRMQNATEPTAKVQAVGWGGCHARAPMAWALLLAALLPSACAKLPKTTNPVTWWHDLQGGAIAEQRPPPPGVGMPYPNLGTVPPKPTPPDPATRQRISNALLQDRSNAQYVASLAPIALPPRPPAPPKSAAADPDATTASLDAVEAPPAKTPVPNASPLTAGDATTAAADNAPPPTIPDAPPAPPVFPGIAIGPTTATPLPKAPPAVAVNKLSESARVPVPVPFATGSAVLPPGAIGPLKQLATRRVGAPPGAAIDITGFGDATDTEPQLQTAGITLGLARAHAIAAALIADGVPANVLRIAAQPSGRGGDARLVDPG